MKYIRKKILVLIILLVIVFTGKTFATENFKKIEKSKEFEKWENLPEEERLNSIQPPYQTVTFRDSVKRSTYNSLLNLRESALPNQYSLKDNIDLKVKNQQETNLCWAFSFTSALESTVAKKYSIEPLEYSPIYTDYVVTRNFKKDIGDGANSDVAIASAVSGDGLAYEADLPFNNYYNKDNNSEDSFYLSYDNIDLSNINPKVKINETTSFAPIYKSYSEDSITYKDSSALFGATKYTDEEVEAIRTQIKRHIKDYGAVMSTVCTQSISGNYNETTHAFYTDYSILSSDHAVTIVGWDDTFAKENFKEGKQPKNDGAYIVLNSWGSEFGDTGYFYVSYDDAFIEQYVIGIDDVQEYSKEAKDYNNLYQYDELGSSIGFYFLNDKLEMLPQGYLANVFSKKDSSKYEYITEVGIYTPVTQGIEIYIDYINGDMKDFELVASYTGSNALEPGYHDLKLASPIEIKGEKFAIIVKYINSEGAMYSLECNLKDTGLTEVENYYSTAKANDGESFISNDGSDWTDINKYKVVLSQDEVITYKNTNACIKAFTITSEKPIEIPVTDIEITEENITINKGNTASIVATVKPNNATNKNVTWSSEEEEIATVENGVVTGVSEGETTITVTTEDGNRSDSVRVTVVEAEPEVVNVTGVKLDANLEESTLKINKGTTYTVNAIVEPNNATNKKVSWSTSDESVAIVESGVITGVSQGTATITVTTEDGNKTASIEVEVLNSSDIKVESIKLNKSTLNLKVGDTTNLVATFNPINATNKNVTWKSSNEKVASITKTGIITALAKGETIITVTTEDGNKTASCKLTVTEKTNTDDDIYKSDGNGDTTNKKDTTTAKVELPNTGLKILLVVLVVGTVLIGVVAFINYRKYFEIK